MKRAILDIEGMTCGGCVGSVKRVLARTPGVGEALMEVEVGSARVSLDDARVTETALRAAIENAGFVLRAICYEP